MFGPDFNSIGNTDGMKLKDIAWTADDSGDALLLIDPVTADYTTLTYINASAAEEYGLTEYGAGWYLVGEDPVTFDPTFEYKGNTQLNRGQGMWVYTTAGESVATPAGEVAFTFERQFAFNVYAAFCNPFPKQMKLKDFKMTVFDSGDTMLFIDPETVDYYTLTYITADAAIEYNLIEHGEGWYLVGEDPDTFDPTFEYWGDVELAPGQGVWLFPTSGDITISASI